ncbi:brachyurin-like [Penaeus vannamei]|uniref:brachyurin-like n=1 Tax=Penaeus vannamei TaxID=6689 RepID=UPI00387F51C2
MCPTIVFLLAALRVSAAAEVPLWKLDMLHPIQVAAEGRPLTGQRIVGGQEAEPHKYGYQALVTDDESFICGGAVVSDRFILTAAHCIKNNAPLFVRVGVHHIRNDTQQLIPVERVHVHPSFHTGAKGIKNDIGIVELENPITMNDKVFPIKLPPHPVGKNKSVVLTGWGSTEDGDPLALQEMSTTIISLKKCREHYPWVDTGILCVLSSYWDVSTCLGDSGGPAAHGDYIRGIVSFCVYDCEPMYPQGLTDVYFYRDWIKEVMFPPTTTTANTTNTTAPTNITTTTTTTPAPTSSPSGSGILDLPLVYILIQLFLYWMQDFCHVYFVH